MQVIGQKFIILSLTEASSLHIGSEMPSRANPASQEQSCNARQRPLIKSFGERGREEYKKGLRYSASKHELINSPRMMKNILKYKAQRSRPWSGPEGLRRRVHDVRRWRPTFPHRGHTSRHWRRHESSRPGYRCSGWSRGWCW